VADTKMFWGRSDKSKMFDINTFNTRYSVLKNGVEQNFTYDEFKNDCNSRSLNFSVITTVMNIFGMIQLENNRLERNIFLDKNIVNKDFLKLYLDYYLSYWQEEKDGVVVKPYLLVLKLLKLLKYRGESPHLSEFEFTETFEEFKLYEDINNDLVDDIVSKRASTQNNHYGLLGYSTKAYLQYSSLLSFDKNGKDEGFFLELKDDSWIDEKIDKLLLEKVRDDIFTHAPTPVKDKNTAWGKFLNNGEKFKGWFTVMSLIDFKKYYTDKGFHFKDDLIRRFILSLETKPFLILTGISGSGKTKIAELYGNFLTEQARGEKFILAIGSNWNDNKKLLGFQNPLQSDPALAYQKTELVDFIKEANTNLDKSYIVILDEMNLSYTEKYFADFLSALESLSHEITLPNGEVLQWTKNLKIVGTINEDETTHTISPKVLDRANVIEMNGMKPSLYIQSQIDKGEELYINFHIEFVDMDNYKTILDDIYEVLNGNFAFRIINEITEYILISKQYNNDLTLDKLLDEQIYQKILPKVHGSKMDLPKKLMALKDVLNDDYINTNEKIQKMLDHVSIHGYASFIVG
jgi:energy-coupling factor transporter ATP-binding protein EcfA2